jgi:hypothetical protein
MRAIIVTDLGSVPAARDKKIVAEGFANICRKTKLSFKPQYFTSNQVGLKTALQNLTCQPDDVLVFYFSGHASNWNGWPSFANRGDEIRYKQTDVYEVLKAKGARLLIVLFDGCNVGKYEETPYSFEEVYTIGLAQNLHWLFRKSRGVVVGCASQTGNYAYGSKDVGSFFTVSLMEAMRDVPLKTAFDKRNVWQHWAKLTRKGANSLCKQVKRRQQNPRFYLDVTTSPNR